MRFPLQFMLRFSHLKISSLVGFRFQKCMTLKILHFPPTCKRKIKIEQNETTNMGPKVERR